MAYMDPQIRQRLLEHRRQLHRDGEEEFAYYLRRARQLMPDRASDPLFVFIVRRLWEPHEGNITPYWLNGLRDRYEEFGLAHAWSMTESVANGTVSTGMESLARLLCLLRKRQRGMEGTGVRP